MQLLSLDVREPPKGSQMPVDGHKKSGPPCMVSSSGPVAEARSGTCNIWTHHKESSLSSRSTRVMSWPERAFSMVEGDMRVLGWMSTDLVHEKPVAVSSTNSLPSSTAAPSSRYKTELCRTFTERGVCKYGSKCQFAHGPEELRGINRHPKYKTEPCRTFHSIGFCPYGIRCHFVHNNEDDARQALLRPSLPAVRPPLLKQSFSFAGFPSTLRPPEPPPLHSPFLCVPSFSPPVSAAVVSDLLTLAFPELGHESDVDQAGDAEEVLSEFLPSPDSGCSLGELTPSQTAPGLPEGCPRQSPLSSACLGPRSQSLASLSDQEGGCSSSASSLSGGDSSAYEGAGRRLPIFSQLSVPDDGFCSEGSNSGMNFFL
ncbi:hypothetical protein P4O66_003104 [Electrophorus voltai]|uniref:mRNA decay activator protein ZFP36 n=1 Tax=Electrophorus voltai TaxID=2609070 RepID=A0AAD9DN34_9TELE|nr:hypothetical protein P4O66_003104 [Electrophorus voltai]